MGAGKGCEVDGLAMTVGVVNLVAVEVRHVIDVVLRTRGFAAGGVGTVIAVVGMEVVIYVAVEVIRAMKPGTSTDEDTTTKPLRAVVAVGARRGCADADCDLSLGLGSICCNAETGCGCGQGEKFEYLHLSHLS